MRLGRTLGWGIAVLAAMAVVLFAFLLGADTDDEAVASGPLYAGTATVVQRGDGSPMVCGALAASDPPACANGLLVTGLRWDEVSGHHHRGQTRWAVAHLLAHYDGDRLALAEAPTLDDITVLEDAVHFGTPCDPPEGGWAVRDGGLVDEAALGNLLRYADGQPDLGRHWVDRKQFPGLGVHNFTFTADLERHRLELAELWRGPICVTQGTQTLDGLERAADGLGDNASLAPAPVVTVGVDEVRGAVRLVGLIADPAFEAWARRQAGAVPVTIEALLQPSDSAQAH